jgi:hypothetical protein
MRSTLQPLLLLVLASACGPEAPTAPGGIRPLDATAAATFAFGRVDNAGGQYTSLVSQSTGRQHISYYDHINSDLKYATCASACTNAGNWQRVAIDQTGNVGQYTSLAFRDGIRHIAYYDVTNTALKYASCASNCLVAANWNKVTIDGAGPALSGTFPSLEVGSDGRRHVIYFGVPSTGAGYRYATCLTNCTVAASWQKTSIALTNSGTWASLALTGDGRIHATYLEPNMGLRYAACASSCVQASNWSKVTVDASSTGGLPFPAIAVASDGSRHLSYRTFVNSKAALTYAMCLTSCTAAASWQKVVVDGGSPSSPHVGWYTSIAVGSDGKRHVSYYDATNTNLKYASCAANCTAAANWQPQTLDASTNNVGLHTSLTLGSGLVHISYFDQTFGDLRYGEVTP